MSTIRAFVGHSFRSSDSTLVQAFLHYFDQVKLNDPRFTWDHAEVAEPIEVPDKILRLFADKTLFIGICTKNERAISEEKLSRSWRPSRRSALESDLEWKTSDWIIQEIGLAIGLKLRLILFVEEGVRRPGAIQGEIEYISFSRDNPERSFGPFLEMISAIVPHPNPTAFTAGAPPTAQQEPNEEVGPSDDWNKPRPDWTRNDYEWGFIRSVLENDESSTATIDDAYKATELAGLVDHLASWEAFKEWAKILFQKKGSISALEKLTQVYPSSAKVMEYYAKSLEHYDKLEDAARSFKLAATLATKEREKVQLWGRAAAAFTKTQNVLDASLCLQNMKGNLNGDRNLELVALRAILEVSEYAKRDDEALAAFERIVDLTPGDNDERFNLAYKYSQAEQSDLALMHYTRIPAPERSAAGWNNLGVAYSKESIPAKAVDSFRRSEEMGETLAMSMT